MTVKLEDLIKSLGLELERGPNGKWVIPANLAETLRDADRMAQDGAGMATVRRVLGISMVAEPIIPEAIAPEAITSEATTPEAVAPVVDLYAAAVEGALPTFEAPTTTPDAEPRGADAYGLPGLVAAAVTGALKTENELGEKYARAAHRIGELEALTRGLETERERLAGELAATRSDLATANGRLSASHVELGELRAELGAARAERDHLRSLRGVPSARSWARPWWKFWG